MNEDMEKKLDQLLADMPKRKYNLDAWLAEDETAEFDRIVHQQRDSSDFAAGSDGKIIGNKPRPLRRWIAAAASLIIIIGIGATLWPTKEESQPLLSENRVDGVSHVDSSLTVGQNVALQSRDSQATSAVKPMKAQKDSGNTIAAPAPATDVTISDPNLHYAALTTTEDSVPYQDPARVDDVITELANYYKVKAVHLSCTSDTGDSTIVSTAYLFKDQNELDLFARLLQVACWYNTKTPGYLLNFSQEQFFFKLEDLRKDERYLWMAERIGKEYVLLFSTRSPKGVVVSSACFQDYREQLTHITPQTLNL